MLYKAKGIGYEFSNLSLPLHSQYIGEGIPSQSIQLDCQLTLQPRHHNPFVELLDCATS